MKNLKGEKPQRSRNQFLRAEQKRKHEEALARQQAAAALTPQQRLAKLDKKLGKGVGAAKERARLQKLIRRPASAGAKAVLTVNGVSVQPIDVLTYDAPPKKGGSRDSKNKKAASGSPAHQKVV